MKVINKLMLKIKFFEIHKQKHISIFNFWGCVTFINQLFVLKLLTVLRAQSSRVGSVDDIYIYIRIPHHYFIAWYITVSLS